MEVLNGLQAGIADPIHQAFVQELVGRSPNLEWSLLVEQQTLSMRFPIGKAMPFLNALGYTRHAGDLGVLPLSELLEKMQVAITHNYLF